jgi:hypothetical protein
MKRGFLRKAPIWLVVLSAIYTSLSYRGEFLTIGGDSFIPFHPIDYLFGIATSSNRWGGNVSQLPPIFSLPPLPDISIFAVLQIFGFDIYSANKLYVFFLASLSSVSIYYFALTIFNKNDNKSLIGLTSAILFLFNPWMILDTYKSMIFTELSIAHTGFVLFLKFLIMSFQTGKIKYFAYSGFGSFLMLSVPGTSAYRMICFASAGLCTIMIYYSLYGISKLHARKIIEGIIVLTSLAFIVNSYWIIPFIQNSSAYVSFTAGFQVNPLFNSYSTLPNTLRLMNAWGFYCGYAPYAVLYMENPFLILLTFSWPIFVFASLFSSKAIENKNVACLYLVTVITTLFACGPNLLGPIYLELIYSSIGSLYPFKPLYSTGHITAHVLTLEYVLLAGFSLSLVYSKLMDSHIMDKVELKKKVAAVGIVFLIISILVASSWPIFAGEVMRNWYKPDQYGVRIPQYYWQANTYIKTTMGPNSRALLLPPTYSYIGTSWGYQGSSQFYNLFINAPLITGNEIAYGITSDTKLYDQVYSMCYKVPENISEDILASINSAIAWQYDNVDIGNGCLQIDFESGSLANSWHQVELHFIPAKSLSGYPFLLIRLNGSIMMEDLQIGIGDSEGFVGWWFTRNHIYDQLVDTLIPVNSAFYSTSDKTRILLLNLEKPDQSYYDASNAVSIWIQYFIRASSHDTNIQIGSIWAIDVRSDDQFYAKILRTNKVDFVLFDAGITEGIRNDFNGWLETLNSSSCFKLIWQAGSLYIFKNEYFDQ